MKKIFVFSVALIGLTACRNDDDKSTNQEASIVGTWQPVKYIAYDGKTNKVIDENVKDDCAQKTRVIFSNDGKTTTTQFESDLQTNSCNEFDPKTGTYEYNSSKKEISILFEGASKSKTTSILKLTDTEFEVVGEVKDINNDGVDDKLTTLYKRVN